MLIPFVQRDAIKAFLRGASVVVLAPTSSGKTLTAESAAAVALVKGRRLLYTTPLKALSNQKYRVSFCEFVLFLHDFFNFF